MDNMNKLDELIEKFRNDEKWNTPNSDGSRRFDEDLVWIREIVEHYSEKLDISVDDVVDSFEKNRDYSWPNYYQKANFPRLDNLDKISVYETLGDFQKENTMFRCPVCHNEYTHPTQCEHRIKKDGICDWAVGGLFKLGLCHVIIKEISLVPMAIFEPVKEKLCENEPTTSKEKLGTIVDWHRRYSFGEYHGFTRESFLKKAKAERWIYVRVYMYDHNGLTFSTWPFTGRVPHAEWDSGFLGYYYVSREKVRNFFGRERISSKLLKEVLELLTEEVDNM